MTRPTVDEGGQGVGPVDRRPAAATCCEGLLSVAFANSCLANLIMQAGLNDLLTKA